MLPLGVSLALVILVPFAVAYGFPRAAVRVLGPVVLGLAAAAFVGLHGLFVPFRSDGSPAGLIVPGIMWFGFIVACIAGVVLIWTGLLRLRWRRDSPEARAADSAAVPGTRTWLGMFNVALGVNIVVSTAPYGARVVSYPWRAAIDFAALYRSLGAFGTQLVGLLLSYVLPAVVLCLVLRAAGLHKTLRFDGRGSVPLAIGNAGVLGFALARLLLLLPGRSVAYSLRVVEEFHELVWLAWAAIPIGLFLLWTARPGRAAGARAAAHG